MRYCVHSDQFLIGLDQINYLSKCKVSSRDDKLSKVHRQYPNEFLNLNANRSTAVYHKLPGLLVPGTYLHLSNSFFHSCLVLAILNFEKKSCCKLFNVAGIPPAGISLYHCRAVPDNTYLIPVTLATSS